MSDFLPRAMFGGLLWGSNAVRYLFMDEAGTESASRVSIVVGILVNADKQLLRAEAAIDEALVGVPQDYRKGFVFSGKDVWSNEAYWEKWSVPNRLAFLRSMMSLPRRLKLPVSLSVVRRGLKYQRPVIKDHQMDHFMAFAACIARADKYIREHGDVEEVGTVVAEQASEMTRFLKEGAKLWRETPMVMPPEGIHLTEKEKRLGYSTQESEQRVSRIRPTIHFVDKNDEKLVLLADACAFGFRRYFAGEKFGDEFVRNILGTDLVAADWAARSSSSVFSWD